MSADVMSVRLHLRGVRVTEVVVDTPLELVVGVVSTKNLSGCPGCGRSCRRVHDRRQRQIRDLEISGLRTVLFGPSAGSCAMAVGSGTWKPISSSRVVSLAAWRGGWSKTPR